MTDTALPLEIERKFIIDVLPDGLDLATAHSETIAQGYLLSTDDSVVRLRRKGTHFYLTVKKALPGHAARRIELECELSEAQFAALWPGTAGIRLEKTRYALPYQDDTIELDIFAGEFAGRMLAEVEFDSIEAADTFEPPAWFGRDVTADKRYANINIVKYGFPTS